MYSCEDGAQEGRGLLRVGSGRGGGGGGSGLSWSRLYNHRPDLKTGNCGL